MSSITKTKIVVRAFTVEQWQQMKADINALIEKVEECKWEKQDLMDEVEACDEKIKELEERVKELEVLN
jgi:predicted nuclease with TOPRIM domain